MTIHINKFIDRVQGHDARGSKDFVMSLADAKNLQADITRLLLQLNDQQKPEQEQVITIKMDGGRF